MTNSRRVAIVTGSSRGIGRAIALRLAQDGLHVVVNYVSNKSKAQQVVDEITALATSSTTEEPVRAIAVQGSIGNLDEGRRLLNATIREFGRLDVVVLNAGWLVYQSIHEMTEQSYQEATSINVMGPAFFSKMAQPYLAKSTDATTAEEANASNATGRIITISTSLTSLSMVQGSHFLYSMTKGALEQMTRVLAKDKEFGGRGITVNTISPGPIDTESFHAGLDVSHAKFFASLHPQNRLGAADDVAGMVSFLASRDSRWVNGQIIRVNGGMGV
ncbi:hypothetical protein BG006_006669 [Podila minutissima]|uniref:Uncharacterized protein n=1 Tax=Podila minutissima TaxID=64525 RepID=A0A9P5VLA8_9FUNG|nr:hypothetical protein BG006_006669 [Podila minutissima]